MARVVTSRAAHRDLRQIWTHIAVEKSEGVADAVLARLQGTMDVVAQAPKIGRIRTEYRGHPRSFAVRPYVIFYAPLEGGILVWRVLHGARDLQALVSPPNPDRGRK